MRDVQQDLQNRPVPVARRLREAVGGQGAEDCVHSGRDVRPHLLQLGFRVAAAGRELGVAVAQVWPTADDVFEIMPIRPGQVEHEVADGVGLFVRSPPNVVFAESLQASADLSRVVGEQPGGHKLQHISAKGVGHLGMISSNHGLPDRGSRHDIRVTFTPSEFRPRFTGGHLQTLYAWAKRRTFPRLPAPVPRFFDVAPDARVLAHCHWQDRPQERPTLLLLHGLEGSSLAHYMGGMADKAWALGWNVVRLNQRNCGDTEHLSRGLYHSGLINDPLHVIRELIETDGIRAIAVAGYSLGGNLALKLAGELGETAPPELKAVCAVSPTMDLAVCVQALERRANLAYQWNFVRRLKARMRRKAEVVPGVFSLEPLRKIWTVRQFDEAYTAPYHGFRDAADYYHRASAVRVVDRARVPVLILTAEDDPFVPVEPFGRPSVTGNPLVTTVVTPHGGHCAFVEHASGEYDGYWAEQQVVNFVTAHANAPSASVRIPAPSPPLRA